MASEEHRSRARSDGLHLRSLGRQIRVLCATLAEANLSCVTQTSRLKVSELQQCIREQVFVLKATRSMDNALVVACNGTCEAFFCFDSNSLLWPTSLTSSLSTRLERNAGGSSRLLCLVLL